jgi:cytochrome d ubiquinol oxidase subunit II
MELSTVPMIFILAGMVFYIVLAGADFGAALWQVTAPRDDEGRALRMLAHDAMGPVWEANHVWLIFVLTVTWTAYPEAFGSVASTLAVGLSVAAFGIITRGAAYATSSGTDDPRELVRIDLLSAISSVLAPFALGACAGAIASGRVPYGNARGDLWASWLNPTSIVIGVLAVVVSAYLAAVYLCADAQRRGHEELVAPFRRRALGAGVVAGALAVAGLVVLHEDAHPLYKDLIGGAGLPALMVSALAGGATLLLVLRGAYEPSRFTAALAVAAVVAGWALAQQPTFLPGLTVEQAAASHDVLVAVVVAVVGGGILLFPALTLLLRLTVGGALGLHGHHSEGERVPPEGEGGARGGFAPEVVGRASAPPVPTPSAARLAAACLVGGFGFLTVAEAGWAHAVGVVLLVGFVVTGFLAAVPAWLAPDAG